MRCTFTIRFMPLFSSNITVRCTSLIYFVLISSTNISVRCTFAIHFMSLFSTNIPVRCTSLIYFVLKSSTNIPVRCTSDNRCEYFSQKWDSPLQRLFKKQPFTFKYYNTSFGLILSSRAAKYL